MQGLGLALSEKPIASPGWEHWDTTSKETRASKGHASRVCEFRNLGILNPKEVIRSTNVTSVATGRTMR